jgi:hypothetical protein
MTPVEIKDTLKIIEDYAIIANLNHITNSRIYSLYIPDDNGVLLMTVDIITGPPKSGTVKGLLIKQHIGNNDKCMHYRIFTRDKIENLICFIFRDFPICFIKIK